MNNSSAVKRGATLMTKTVSITSGKGGVGKTTTVSNIAYHLSREGKRVLILDGDLGMANVDIMFGKRAQWSIHDVLSGEKHLQEIICPLREGIDLIPGGSGVYGLHQMSIQHRYSLLQQVSDLEVAYDYMLIDTAPGIDENVLHLNSAAQRIVILVTPDPSSLTDAYALIKVLNQKRGETKFSIVANQVGTETEGLRLYKRLCDVADQFLCVSLDYLGDIRADLNLRQATRSQQLVSEVAPNSSSAAAFGGLVEKLSLFDEIHEAKGAIQFFWEHVSGVA
jgi:flagellar biosynthesis protein FlhG